MKPVPCAILSALFTLAACGSHEQAGSQPAPHTPDAVAPVEQDGQAAPTQEGSETFLAVVWQSGREHCPDGASIEWVDLRPTLGWVDTSGSGDALEALVGKPVLARGRTTPAPDRPASPAAEGSACPIMQMRSDWVATPRGFRSQRGGGATINHFETTSVRALDELTVTQQGDRIEVALKNPLPFALHEVALRMHYEGCYGKPGSTSRESESMANLGAGETIRYSFPVIAEYETDGPRKGGPSAHVHLADELELVVGGSDAPADAPVHVDFTLRLRDQGLTLDCPER